MTAMRISTKKKSQRKETARHRTFLSLLPAIAILLGGLFSFPSPSSSSQGDTLYSILIPFEEGGIVRAVLPDQSTFPIGTVRTLPEKAKWPAYTASKWGVPGTVAASAVNAIHLLISVDGGKGKILSLIPSETIAPAAGAHSSLVIDGKGGHALFGGWAPPVGTPVTIVNPSGSERPLSSAPLPGPGEILRMDVSRQCSPYMIEIENRPGGRVFSWSRKYGQTGVIARVIRPVRGTGRFEGTLFQSVGRIRANHPGVIDISTSSEGAVGGFQIIPFNHARSPEMAGAWNMTQWLILDSPDGKTSLAGQPPLFGGALVPGTGETEHLWDLWSTYGRKPLVLCRLDGGKWERLPEVSGRQDHALERLTHLRIYFPIAEEPIKLEP